MGAAISSSVSVIAGQNLGVERYDRVSDTCKWGLVFTLAITAIPCSLAFFFPEMIMQLFTDKADVIAVGCGYLKISAITYFLVDITMALQGIPLAAGQTYIVTFTTILATCLVRVPLAYILHSTKLGITGIWLSVTICQVVANIFLVCYYLSGKWKIKNLISTYKDTE